MEYLLYINCLSFSCLSLKKYLITDYEKCLNLYFSLLNKFHILLSFINHFILSRYYYVLLHITLVCTLPIFEF